MKGIVTAEISAGKQIVLRSDDMDILQLVLIFVLVPVMAVSFLAGIILLIAGIVNKTKPKNAGKKFPAVLISFGVTLLVLPALIFAFGIAPGIRKAFSEKSIPERWQNTRVGDSQASDEAIKALMEAAGDGDRKALTRIFAAEVRNSSSFKAELDSFFGAYPAALSQCGLKGGSSGSSGSYNYGHNVLTGSGSYTCDLEGERYFINISFCYENTDEPDKVGVRSFSVMNLGARALYIQEFNKKAMEEDYEDDRALICDIKGSNEVNARLIGGYPFVWHPTDNKKLTAEGMRTLLSETEDMSSLIQKTGEPNVSMKYSNSTGYDYYYELAPENGEPRYAFISASSPTGRIIDAYVYTSEKGLYEDPLKAFRKQDE